MERIRTLNKLTSQELLDLLAKTAETARDAGEPEEYKNALDEIEDIIYTLRNCKGDD